MTNYKYTSIPNFNDPYAKVQERTHSSGAKIIDILYGARDRNGNPTSPENSSDGHGHFIAIEIDGLYQVLSWRHSRSEGGGMDEGSDRIDNPLRDLEEGIKEKWAVLRQAQEAMKSRNYDTASLDSILSRFSLIFDYNTPVERELKEKYNRLVSKNEEKKRFRADRIYKIQQNIDNLRDRLYTTRNYEKQMQIEGWISENEAQIREIENEIYRMESEMR